jgi:hypothetical protein
VGVFCWSLLSTLPSKGAAPTLLFSWPGAIGTAAAVVVTNGVAFVAVASGGQVGGLGVYEVSNPAQPTPIGSLNFDNTSSASTLFLAGQTLYLAQGSLKIIDVSDPTTPAQVGSYQGGGGVILGVCVAGNYAYLATGTTMDVVDISDRTQPVRVGSIPTTQSYAVTVEGTRAYVADRDAGIKIVDISTPATPVVIGTYNTASSAYNVTIAGNLLYVADGNGGLVILDVTNPANPTLVKTFGTGNGSRALDVKVVGNRAYLAADIRGLILNVSNPAAPTILGHLPGMPLSNIWIPANPGLPQRLMVDGERVYIASASYGLQIVDAANAGSPALLGDFSALIDVNTYADVATSGTTTIVAGNAGTLFLDISNPAKPKKVRWEKGAPAKAAFARGELGLVSREGLRIYSLSDPQNPAQIGSYNLAGSSALEVRDNFAFLANTNKGITILDITYPTTPSLIGSITMPAAVNIMAARGSYLYVGTATGVRIVNISSPGSPTLVGSSPFLAGNIAGLDIYGDKLFAAELGGDLHVYSLTNPEAPAHLGIYDDAAQGLTASRDRVWLFNPRTQVISVNNPALPTWLGSSVGGRRGWVEGRNLAAVGSDGIRILDVGVFLPVNSAAPTLSTITNQTIQKNGSTAALGVVPGDAESSVDELELSGFSSNPSLVRNADIVFRGTGANHTVTVTPVVNQTGTATISVVVNDGEGKATTNSFLVTVNEGGAGPALDLNILSPQPDATVGNTLNVLARAIWTYPVAQMEAVLNGSRYVMTHNVAEDTWAVAINTAGLPANGSFSLQVEARDDQNNLASKTVTVLRKGPPNLVVRAPRQPQFSRTAQVFFDVEATSVSGDVRITAKIGALTVLEATNSFAGNVTIPEGTSTVNISGSDAGGETTISRILYVDTNPRITEEFVVAGKILDARNGTVFYQSADGFLHVTNRTGTLNISSPTAYTTAIRTAGVYSAGAIFLDTSYDTYQLDASGLALVNRPYTFNWNPPLSLMIKGDFAAYTDREDPPGTGPSINLLYRRNLTTGQSEPLGNWKSPLESSAITDDLENFDVGENGEVIYAIGNKLYRNGTLIYTEPNGFELRSVRTDGNVTVFTKVVSAQRFSYYALDGNGEYQLTPASPSRTHYYEVRNGWVVFHQIGDDSIKSQIRKRNPDGGIVVISNAEDDNWAVGISGTGNVLWYANPQGAPRRSYYNQTLLTPGLPSIQGLHPEGEEWFGWLGASVLRVDVNGTGGGTNNPPSLAVEILQPISNTVTTNSLAVIARPTWIYAVTNAEALFNGTRYPLTHHFADDTWRTVIDVSGLPSNGTFPLSVEVKDERNNVATSATVMVVRDGPPTLTVNQPASDIFSATRGVEFDIVGADATGDTHIVGKIGTMVIIDGTNSFHQSVTLPLGFSTVSITATDARGQTSSAIRNVRVDENPRISVDFAVVGKILDAREGRVFFQSPNGVLHVTNYDGTLYITSAVPVETLFFSAAVYSQGAVFVNAGGVYQLDATGLTQLTASQDFQWNPPLSLEVNGDVAAYTDRREPPALGQDIDTLYRRNLITRQSEAVGTGIIRRTGMDVYDAFENFDVGDHGEVIHALENKLYRNGQVIYTEPNGLRVLSVRTDGTTTVFTKEVTSASYSFFVLDGGGEHQLTAPNSYRTYQYAVLNGWILFHRVRSNGAVVDIFKRTPTGDISQVSTEAVENIGLGITRNGNVLWLSNAQGGQKSYFNDTELTPRISGYPGLHPEGEKWIGWANDKVLCINADPDFRPMLEIVANGMAVKLEWTDSRTTFVAEGKDLTITNADWIPLLPAERRWDRTTAPIETTGRGRVFRLSPMPTE